MPGQLTNVVGPLQLYRHVRIAMIVSFYAFYDSNGCEILDKHDGGSIRQGQGVIEAC